VAAAAFTFTNTFVAILVMLGGRLSLIAGVRLIGVIS